MIDTEYYSPHAIKYTRQQIRWLIPLMPLLRSGIYPTKSSYTPKDNQSGYLEYKVLVKRGNPQAKFVRAAEIAAELDYRTQRCGLDGLLLELLYTTEPDDELFMIQHIAVALSEDIERVSRRIRNALQFCSGSGRKVARYKEWLKDRQL